MEGEPAKKYTEYPIDVDPEQDDKATQLKLCSFGRPHMRAFHLSWWSFFIAFFIWFSIAPLLPVIKKDLGLSNQDIWTTNIVAVIGDIIMRFILGAQCDKYGARIIMGTVLICASIPTSLTGLANNVRDLILIRLFIGVAGSCFVACQYWSTCMFTKEIVGTANALVGGWGNVGGGVTQIVMGTALFPLFTYFYGGDQSKAWRTVCIVPAVVAFTTGLVVIKIGDDCPSGQYSKLKKTGQMPHVSAAASFRQGALDFNTWILFIQYGCCFGVELTMNNAAVSYFVERFGLGIESASAIASIFGFMNIFARGIGGFMSDKFMVTHGMRGRILWQGAALVIEGCLILIFAHMSKLWAAILLLTVFSILVQAAEGSTYGIVPYVNPGAPGAVSGIVGAGGPTGAVSFGLGFRQLAKTQHAYILMGSVVILSGFISVLININGHRGICCGKDEELPRITIPNTGDVEKDVENKA
eukprot:CAMPEP_0195526092 /NCGR_PEP_ID=MMETSP0794_2-20130614/26960_1 /TAXON_ID=515487 /ORGANISM="Stephanopyxis turris, Strain CCMP 815" /LENGTH=469 /DNA_ID=CAMNT_0040656707 /DNA_START=115 /DNA_END=1524 /DNA_ORIENTATION=-